MKLVKIACSLALIVTLVIAASPAAEASYYGFLRQYLQEQQNQPAPQPPAQPQPEPAPQPGSSNFWAARAAARRNLLENPAQPQPQPAPQPEPEPVPQPDPAPQPTQLTAREQLMLNLVNQERVQRGLNPLQADMGLTKLARIKSQDIVDNNYFAHHSPTLGSAFDMMRAEGISFLLAGENLSRSGSTQISHYRLMNSPSHRSNILNPHYTHIGIGIVDGHPSGVVVTQMFIQAP